MHAANLEAPQCTSWCETTHDGWDETGPDITKTCTCTRRVTDDLDGQPVTVTLERFATVDYGAVTINAPEVRVNVMGSLGMRAALALAQALQELGELAPAARPRSGVALFPSYAR